MDTMTDSHQWTDWKSQPDGDRVRAERFGVWVLEEREALDVSGKITRTLEVYPSRDVESFADPEEAQTYARDLFAAVAALEDNPGRDPMAGGIAPGLDAPPLPRSHYYRARR